MEERFQAQEAKLRSEFGDESEFRSAMVDTVRMLAGDLIRLSRGQQLEFADRYADRYDIVSEDYRGPSSEHSSKQEEKTSESVFPVTYKFAASEVSSSS